MRLGFNYAWSYNLCGADIGPNPHVPAKQWLEERRLTEGGQVAKVPPAKVFDHLDRNLANLRGMGIEVVRYWILANGFNFYGQSGPNRRNTPSPTPGLPYYDWAFFPPFTTDRRYLVQFEELLKRFQKAGMEIIPSLLSFEFAGNSRSRDGLGLAPGGKADCIKDPNVRQVFLGTLLTDLLKVSAPYKKIVYAWEVMNEPFWNLSPIGPLSKADGSAPSPGSPSADLARFARYPEISRPQMHDFLTEATQLIESKGFASTVGHRFYRDIDPKDPDRLPTGSKPQFHYYAKPALGFGDPYQIGGQNMFAGEPKPFLGEFDSDLNRSGLAWTELQRTDTTRKRLQLLRDEHCDLALLWADMGGAEVDHIVADDPIKMMPTTRQAVVDFTSGKLPPANE